MIWCLFKGKGGPSEAVQPVSTAKTVGNSALYRLRVGLRGWNEASLFAISVLWVFVQQKTIKNTLLLKMLHSIQMFPVIPNAYIFLYFLVFN